MSSLSRQSREQPSVALSLVLFVAFVAFMAWLRLVVFGDRYITLTYGLPLLVCLWHQDRRLLWALSVAFIGISAVKTFIFLPGLEQPIAPLQWVFQVVNILVTAIAVHLVLLLAGRLRQRNAELEQANANLIARDEEISRQNEELQNQAEELSHQNEELQSHNEEINQQNEELQHQGEELQQQGEELQSQADALQTLNAELQQREAMLQALLSSLAAPGDEAAILKRICGSLLDLFAGRGQAACVIEHVGEDLVLRTQAGMTDLARPRWPLANSFAAVVNQECRTAYVDDLHTRPDLVTAQSGQGFRSILGTPLKLGGRCSGAVEVYSHEPRHWTTDDFRIIEWVAAQCSLILDSMRLHEQIRQNEIDLAQANNRLEELVRDRTARLQEMVNELEHFSYSITHDMRAPLRAMQGFAAMLEEECGPALNTEHRACLRRIISSANRMDRLITDALSYSRTVREDLAVSPVDAEALLRNIIESYPVLQPPKADIQIEGAIPKVRANEAGLTQCFSNLLNNAVKFVAKGTVPLVRVRAERENGFVRIWFEDNGIGVPERMKDRLFGMFQRGSKDYEGTGIGLALVRKVAERMGGRVGVTSEQGKGSRFWLELKSGDTVEFKA
jgi:signal transduction histidine kinase